MNAGSKSVMKRCGFGGTDLARCSRLRSGRNRISRMRSHSNWQWHLDEVFVKINGETHYLWRAVDHEGEVLESYVTKRRDRKAALKFIRKSMKRYGQPQIFVTDKLRSYGAAMKVIGNLNLSKQAAGLTIAPRTHTCRFDDESGRCSVSGKCDVCRNSPPFILQSTTISIRNATFTHATTSSSTEPPHSLSGASFVPHKFTHSGAN